MAVLGGRGRVYVPTDVGVPMVLVAGETVRERAPWVRCRPLVVDLLMAGDLVEAIEGLAGRGRRVVTFFGMIPNFEPREIFGRVAVLIREGDVLLVSANLAAGREYRAGVERVLPQYDNDETRRWLGLFLQDLGFEVAAGEMRFGVENCPAGSGLFRVGVRWEVKRRQEVRLGGNRIAFETGESLDLFFSYRHTPDTVRALLGEQGLGVRKEWIAEGGEEGVFLCGRQGSTPEETADGD